MHVARGGSVRANGANINRHKHQVIQIVAKLATTIAWTGISAQLQEKLFDTKEINSLPKLDEVD